MAHESRVGGKTEGVMGRNGFVGGLWEAEEACTTQERKIVIGKE
jgi:hypothetical protein